MKVLTFFSTRIDLNNLIFATKLHGVGREISIQISIDT
jgi:hypothetical protein